MGRAKAKPQRAGGWNSREPGHKQRSDVSVNPAIGQQQAWVRQSMYNKRTECREARQKHARIGLMSAGIICIINPVELATTL